MKSFQQRRKQHDDIVVPIVVGLFQQYGFDSFNIGHETDNDQLKDMLQGLYDRTSLMLRYRPDKIFVKKECRSILAEIKSESQGRPNFAIEIDSYQAAKEWDSGYNHVLYIFVTYGPYYSAKSCWVKEIQLPKTIYLPDRSEYELTLKRLENEYPNSTIKITKHKSGSGTPYFLLPKSSEYLVSLEDDILIEYA